MTVFWIWALGGVFFLGIGIYAWRAVKPVSFWTGVQAFPIAEENVKAYNRAVAKLWFGFAAAFLLFGLPLFVGQNKALVIVPIVGCVVFCIVLMAVYTRIEARFRKK